MDAKAIDLFEAALDRDPADRETWLAEACGDNLDLCAKVGRMLAVDGRKGVLDVPVEIEREAEAVEVPVGIGKSIGPYRILEELGRGGMGVVYKARDERLDRFVALKFVSASLSKGVRARDRLFREARAASALDHPNICTVYDVGETNNGDLFIAMACYEGETVAARLANGPMPLDECLDVARQIADALECAHEASIVHCDIKPSNVMLTRRGECKILDFGIARLERAGDITAGDRAVTLLYASPEQITGRDVDHRADLWSLGVVLYEMVTGHVPFNGRNDFEIMESVLRSDPSPPSSLRTDLPPELDVILLRALSKPREERFHSARAFGSALKNFAVPVAGGPSKVPSVMTSFLGRDREIKRVGALLASSRLVTMTGPAGTGKTRLSLEIGKRSESGFPDGVVFVPLAAARDTDSAIESIAQAVGVLLNGGRAPLEQLLNTLNARNTLLILDNFEQLLCAAPAVGQILQRAPGIKILVTSRVALRLSGEQEFPVPPLDLTQFSDEWARPCPAVQLFAERARAILPDFAVTPQNYPVLSEICARLDGLPLAIELAAARSKVLSPQAIAARLGNRLDLLKSALRDGPERHQTLRQALAWSHDLLTEPERRVFRRCAVFASTFSLDSLERVCAGFGDLQDSVLDLAGALLDHSLLMRRDTGEGEPRLYMLETIREYACERLKEAGEEERALNQHLEQFRRMALQTDEALAGGAPQAEWLARVEAWHDDIRSALVWLEAHGRVADAIEICAGVWRFWMARGHLRTGRDHIERLLALAPPGLPDDLRARALNGCGTLAHGACDMPGARQLLQEALALFRSSGNERGVALVLNNLSWIDIETNFFETAKPLAEEAYRIYSVLDEKRGMGVALNNLGWIASFRCRFDDAKDYHSRSIALRRAAGDLRGSAFGLSNLAWTEQRCGNYGRALELTAEASCVLAGMSDFMLEAWAGQIRGAAQYEMGLYEGALAGFEKSAPIWRRVGNTSGLAFSRIYAASVNLKLGRIDQAEKDLDEALQALQIVSQDWGVGMALLVRSRLRAAKGDLEGAIADASESIPVLSRPEDIRTVAECHESLALYFSLLAPDAARMHLERADEIRAALGVPVPPCWAGDIAGLRRLL